MPALLAAFVFAYLVGSFPSGVVIARLAGAADPRGIGSGNIGATNVLRTGRRDLAALTLLADAFKGTLAVLVVSSLAARTAGTQLPAFAAMAACGAFLGHLFPVFLGFRGGKGVATYLGCLLGLAWPAAIAFAAIWLIVAVSTRYSSAAALAASAATPLVLLLLDRPNSAALFALLGAVLWLKHGANLGRLLAGTESKIGRSHAAGKGHESGMA